MRRPTVTTVAAYVLIAALVLATGWLITHPFAGAVNGFDDPVSRWFAEHRTTVLDRVASGGTFLGDTLFALVLSLVVGLVSWRLDKSALGLLLVVLVDVGHLGIYLLATHLDPRLRPPVPILDTGLVPDHSFPSGHVGTAVIVYGAIAVLLALRIASPLRRRAALTVLLAVPVVVALSRLYQGAHHVTDVTASLLYAGAWLAVVTRAVRPPAYERWRGQALGADAP